MLTGAIPEEYRRVTGCAQEGNRKVTGRLPECTGGLPECTGGLPECTGGLPEFAQLCRSRDSYVWEGSGGLLEVGRLQLEASLGLQIMLCLLAYSTPSHCPPPRAHQNATGDKFSAPAACSLVHRDNPLKPTGIPLPHHNNCPHQPNGDVEGGNGPLNPSRHQTCSKPQRQS